MVKQEKNPIHRYTDPLVVLQAMTITRSIQYGNWTVPDKEIQEKTFISETGKHLAIKMWWVIILPATSRGDRNIQSYTRWAHLNRDAVKIW